LFDLTKLINKDFILNKKCIIIADKILNVKPSCLGYSGKELLARTYPGNTGFDSQGNNVWSVRMPLRMSRISRLPLVEEKYWTLQW